MSLQILNSITIAEPKVFLSDILLSLACFWCYINFKSIKDDSEYFETAKNWRRFFLFEGISFFAGGIAHGFYEYFGDTMHFVGWYASVIGVFYFTWGMMKISHGGIVRPVAYLLFFAVITSAVTSALLRAFWVIVAYSFLSMFVVVALNTRAKIISFKKKQSKGILIGTGLFILSAVVHIFRMDFFGVKSAVLSHIVIAVGIVFFGRGCMETIHATGEKNNANVQELAR
jgi:hypothetical protein